MYRACVTVGGDQEVNPYGSIARKVVCSRKHATPSTVSLDQVPVTGTLHAHHLIKVIKRPSFVSLFGFLSASLRGSGERCSITLLANYVFDSCVLVATVKCSNHSSCSW
jgi:hypothetical protein